LDSATVEPVGVPAVPTAADIGALIGVVVSGSPEVVPAVVLLAFEDFDTADQTTKIDLETTELELVDLPSEEGVDSSLVTVACFGMELIVEEAQVAVVAAPQVG